MNPQTGVIAQPLTGRLVPALLMLTGLVLIGIVGFGSGELVHEFVHDARHVLAFPCH